MIAAGVWLVTATRRKGFSLKLLQPYLFFAASLLMISYISLSEQSQMLVPVGAKTKQVISDDKFELALQVDLPNGMTGTYSIDESMLTSDRMLKHQEWSFTIRVIDYYPNALLAKEGSKFRRNGAIYTGINHQNPGVSGAIAIFPEKPSSMAMRRPVIRFEINYGNDQYKEEITLVSEEFPGYNQHTLQSNLGDILLKLRPFHEQTKFAVGLDVQTPPNLLFDEEISTTKKEALHSKRVYHFDGKEFSDAQPVDGKEALSFSVRSLVTLKQLAILLITATLFIEVYNVSTKEGESL